MPHNTDCLVEETLWIKFFPSELKNKRKLPGILQRLVPKLLNISFFAFFNSTCFYNVDFPQNSQRDTVLANNHFLVCSKSQFLFLSWNWINVYGARNKRFSQALVKWKTTVIKRTKFQLTEACFTAKLICCLKRQRIEKPC